jgi:hypothetical protein
MLLHRRLTRIGETVRRVWWKSFNRSAVQPPPPAVLKGILRLTPDFAFFLHDLPSGKRTLSAAIDQSMVDLCPLVSAPNTSDNRANKKQPDGDHRREETASLVRKFGNRGITP